VGSSYFFSFSAKNSIISAKIITQEFPMPKELAKEQIDYLVSVIIYWLRQSIDDNSIV
jgi:hypothetical protein